MSAVSMDPRIRARRIEVMRLRGRRRLRWLAVLAALVLTALAIFAVLRSALFDVDAIEVTGATNADVDAIVEAAEPLISQPLLEVELSPVTEEVAQLPWVADVKASTSMGGTVTLAITEREPAAALLGVTGWLLVDIEGRVLDQVDTLPADIVLVDGATWDAAPGDWVAEDALEAIELSSLLPASLAADVASVVRGDELELVLFGGGTVRFGDVSELDEKFLAVLTMLDQVSLDCLDRIDVRAPSVPVLTRLPECS